MSSEVENNNNKTNNISGIIETLSNSTIQNNNNESNELAAELAKEYKSVAKSKYKPYDVLFNSLYKEYPLETCRLISRNERDLNNYTSSSLTYGEIEYEHFKLIFNKLYEFDFPLTGGTFLDIGCGSGRPVFASAFLHDFDTCIGIEILEGLYNVCNDVFVRWRKHIKFQCPKVKQDIEFRFYHGDAVHLNWYHADVIFANTTCFTKALMKRISHKANQLRPGTFFITTTFPLPSTEFEVLEKFKMKETWGDATVFLQRKMFPQEDTSTLGSKDKSGDKSNT